MAKLVPFETKVGTVIQVADIMVSSLEKYMELLPKYDNVNEVWLFGSTLEERCNIESDVDLYVVYDGTYKMFRYMLRDIFSQWDTILLDDVIYGTYDEFYTENPIKVVREIREKGKLLYDSKFGGSN